MDMNKRIIILIVGIFIYNLVLNLITGSAGTIVGKVNVRGIKNPKDILIYIEDIKGKTFEPPEEPAKMDQLNLVFIPRVLPILKGTSVEFHNSDDLKHNVFGVGVEDFDLGVWTKGITKTYTFNNLGDVAILCNVHPEMEAYIVVLQNPYYSLTDKDGNYKIEDVPAGNYKLKTWHDRLRPDEKTVDVPSNGEVVVNFELRK